MRKFYWFTALLLTCCISYGQPFKIYNSDTQQEITLLQLAESVPSGAIVLFGEEHNDSIAHLLQHELFIALHKRFGSKTMLTMEMFQRDVQYIIDEYLGGLISENNFVKESRSWNNYKDYRPLVEYAKNNQLKVIAANAPSRYVNMVTRGGLQALYNVPKATRKLFAPLPVDTLTETYHQKFLEIMGGHDMPGMKLYQSQNFWDATMADAILKAQKKHKPAVILQLNGRFHTDYHTGLTERLRRRKSNVVSVSSFTAEDFDHPDWNTYKKIADYIIVTKP